MYLLYYEQVSTYWATKDKFQNIPVLGQKKKKKSYDK